MDTVNNVFLWGAILFCLICLYQMLTAAQKRQEKAAEMAVSDRAYLILLAAAALAALAVRLWQFGSVPGGFNQDGAMAAVDGKALADYGTDRYGMKLPVHLTAWGYGQMSALLSYLMVPFIRLFGFSPLVLRLPQLIVSLAGLICLYFFIRDVFGKNMALVVLLFAAVNPWHILQSRWVLDCNLYPHFFLFGIYFLHRGLQKRWALYVSMVFFGLSMYCYGISIYTMPVFLVMACVYLLVTKRIRIPDAVLCALVYVLVGGPFILVMMINFFQWDTIETPLFTLPYFSESIRSNDILFFSEEIGTQLVENIKSLLNVTLLQVKDLPWNDIEGFGTMYLFSMPFVVLGLVSLWKRYRKNPGAILLFFFLLTGILCGILTNGVNVNRINIIYYPIMILAGLGIFEAVRWFWVSRWCLLAVYAVSFCLFANTYFTTYAAEIRGYFHGDFGDALEAVEDAEVDKYYITNYCDASDLTEILILFHHEIDAEYFQGKTDQGELPFAEKYTISDMSQITVNPEENAAYVISMDEIIYFDTAYYDVQEFGSYCALTPKQ
ncbi:MAG: glycosyltransferase family 39 protein [Clostridiaceae bacterium]|nr:glycosyltransferase family 39 protein [Clostridiaceae bacterium]